MEYDEPSARYFNWLQMSPACKMRLPMGKLQACLGSKGAYSVSIFIVGDHSSHCSLSFFYTYKICFLSRHLALDRAHQLGNSLGVLRTYYALGVRYITLTHSCNNAFADSAGVNLRTAGSGEAFVSRCLPPYHLLSTNRHPGQQPSRSDSRARVEPARHASRPLPHRRLDSSAGIGFDRGSSDMEPFVCAGGMESSQERARQYFGTYRTGERQEGRGCDGKYSRIANRTSFHDLG
jgi:hypothetical protein